MKSGLSFLVAARQCEILELERLAQACELVSRVARLVHALQRERGAANLYLASDGRQFAAERRQQVTHSDELQREVMAHFDALDPASAPAGTGARLFARIAAVLHGLESLPALRQRIDHLAVPAPEATGAYVRLIANLLAVVFEAADSAGDPEVSRALIAMFNFMQGKEFAGQERAFGAAVFASGRLDDAVRQHWQHLIDTQQGCLQLFADFADPAVLAVDLARQDAHTLADIERLRRIGLHPAQHKPPAAALGEQWYQACTRRIDAMRSVEEALALNLQRVCARQVAQAREGLRDQQALLDELLAHDSGVPAAMPGRYGPHLERSILGMVQEQSRRLQAMSDELDTVRAAFSDRKLVERAKGLLMAHRQLTEEEAHKLLRTTAMHQNRRIVDVAEAVLTMAEVLPPVAAR